MSLMVELKSEYGLERIRIPILRKYNIGKKDIERKMRTRPHEGLSAILIGRNVNSVDEVRDFAERYFKEIGLYSKISNMNLQL